MNIFSILLVSMFVFANDFTFNKNSGQAVPNYCGEIKMFRGGVFKENNGQLTPVKEGTRFYKNDKIVTEAKSFAKILMIDDSTIQLGANSEIRISEFQYNSKTDRKMVIAMIRGQLRSLIKNKAKEGDLEIKTKLAVMGIRGTELLINHQELKNISVSEFGLLEGLVDISNLKNEKFKLNPQSKLTIVQDSNSKNEVSDSQSFLEDEKKSLLKEEEFMPLFLPEKVLPTSPVYPLIHASSASQSNAPTGQLPEAQQVKKSSLNWQENLKKLNEKLKENQKKR